MEEKRIGILGGTFDPLHFAHLRLAEESLERLNLDRVLLLLSAIPPHKEAAEVTPFETRWDMLRKVCSKHPKLTPLDLEAKRKGPSYTIDTLKTLRGEFGEDVTFFLLVGMDCAVEFTTWKSFEEILDHADLAVYGRPGEKIGRVDSRIRDRMTLLDWEEMGISSTGIRQKVAEGKSIRYLVPPEVEEIILKEKLYLQDDVPDSKSQDEISQGGVLV